MLETNTVIKRDWPDSSLIASTEYVPSFCLLRITFCTKSVTFQL